MKDIKLVVFDMAGTTVNEDNVVYKTVQRAFVEWKFDISLDVVLRLGAGKEKYKAIIDILKEATTVEDVERTAKKIFQNFKNLLNKSYANLRVTPYDGVEELFQTLRSHHITIVLNTGYDSNTAKVLLHKLNWKIGKQIDALITADDVENGRPSSEMIDKAMEIFSISDSSQVLKAGDSIIDIEEGKNAHCGITVGVLTGAHTREQLEKANPTFIINSLAELGKILLH